MSTACDGKSSCTVNSEIFNGILDPCDGKKKVIDVSWTCEYKGILAENYYQLLDLTILFF